MTVFGENKLKKLCLFSDKHRKRMALRSASKPYFKLLESSRRENANRTAREFMRNLIRHSMNQEGALLPEFHTTITKFSPAIPTAIPNETITSFFSNFSIGLNAFIPPGEFYPSGGMEHA